MRVQLEKDYYLRISDFDCRNRLRSSSILDIFQDIAACHANELGIGFDSMITNETIWVLSKVKYEMVKEPSMYETVHVKTWPLKPNKIIFRREYLIEDMDGNILVKGTSEWVVMHSVKRKLVPAEDVFPIKEGFVTEEVFDEKLKKVPDVENSNDVYTVLTTFSDCDINGHVNNTKYANYVLDGLNLSNDEVIKEMQTDYHQEVIGGTRLDIVIKRENKEIYAKGMGEDGKKKFSCHIKLH